MESSNSSYHFGRYYLSERECVLLRDGRPVALRPKAFDTLLVLVRNSGHLVEKDELMRQVWPETAVEEANLTQNIFTLRRILGESEEKSKYIETVPRRGYRFVAAVREVAEPVSTLTAPPLRDQAGEIAGLASERATGFLAVLPFVNVSGDANVEYLSDGITESIINSLSQLPMLRVMSRSAVFRYRGRDLDAQRIGRELGVNAVLVGRVHSQDSGFLISAELVDVVNGWQLWGETYDRESRAILEVQNEISSQISAALRLKLTGEEERRLSKRFTESPEAYRAYLEGRYYWSKYTREGLEQAIACFRQAIDFDPTYALAYAGIVDCYLRLATNYLPPEDILPHATAAVRTIEIDNTVREYETPLESVKLRYEWDQKAAERELKRATEMKSDYPAAHQWHAAYQFSLSLFREAHFGTNLAREQNSPIGSSPDLAFDAKLARQFQSSSPTPGEKVQIYCAVAREQIDAGNYEAACAVLQRWWIFGEWPRLEGLSADSSADLLFTAGALAGCVASTRQVPRGQKHAESLLNGSIALFEQLGSKTRSAEGRIELAYCYYREGLYDLARTTLQTSLKELSVENGELRSAALIRSAGLERNAGCPRDALVFLNQAAEIVELAGPWITGRYHLELATTLKELAIAEGHNEYFTLALEQFHEGLYEFKAIGNHRYAAILENNYGYLLLILKKFGEAEARLGRARKLFDSFGDKVRRAQVDETLAQLHLAVGRFELAGQAIAQSVETLELGGEEAVLAESLTTQGVVFCRLGRHREAKRVLDRANQVAASCGDSEAAGRALLIVIEEMCEELDNDERVELGSRLDRLLAHSQQASTLERLQKCHERMNRAHASSAPPGCDEI
jgi:TolB-like protein